MNVREAIKRLLLFPHDYQVRARWTGCGEVSIHDYPEGTDLDAVDDYNYPIEENREIDEHDIKPDKRYKIVWIDLKG